MSAVGILHGGSPDIAREEINEIVKWSYGAGEIEVLITR